MRTGMYLALLSVLVIACLPLLGRASLPKRPTLPTLMAMPPGNVSQLDLRLQPALDNHPGKSGFRLVPDGVEAFALRAMTARAAGRSLDIQYYIWHNDTTGRLLMRELVTAADRGVRVRLLLDDMDARANNFALAGLDAHPNIEVRVFNPFNSRRGMFGKAWESVSSFRRINHRMHNKSWIVDNRIAVTGGRNIGDEYFSASDHVNFFDLDYALLGPAVQALSGSFDAYWNSKAVYPIAVLSPELVNQASLDKLLTGSEQTVKSDQQSTYIKALEESDPIRRILDQDLPFQWSSNWQVLSDDPLKALNDSDAIGKSAVLQGLSTALTKAERNITLISPYFVPGKQGTANLIAAKNKGIEVSILTNSLAANDVAVVHGGYSKYRKELIKGGVQLFELKPTLEAKSDKSFFGTSGASLHTKAAVMDDDTVFVGSFNLDPRSVSLNCEQGILVEHPQLAKEMRALYSTATAGQFSWRVELDADEKLTWKDDKNLHQSEPDAGFSRRFQAFLMRILPVETQL